MLLRVPRRIMHSFIDAEEASIDLSQEVLGGPCPACRQVRTIGGLDEEGKTIDPCPAWPAGEGDSNVAR
jgi:hypothetical protein